MEPEEKDDILDIEMFTLEERNILKYVDVKDGRRVVRKADPMIVESRFMSAARRSGQDIGTLFDVLAKNDPSKDPECEPIVLDTIATLEPIVHAAFATKPFDPETGDGLTVAEFMANLKAFIQLQASVKKNTAPSQDTSAPITVGPPDGIPAA